MLSRQYITDEYTANLRAVEEAFPAYKVLTEKQKLTRVEKSKKAVLARKRKKEAEK